MRQLQVPALAVACVLLIERVEEQRQGQAWAEQGVGFDLRQVERHRVLACTRVDAALQETHEVEGVGVQGGRGGHSDTRRLEY
ncbi:hypothetical protein D3C80_1523870 [compost metagenome]